MIRVLMLSGLIALSAAMPARASEGGEHTPAPTKKLTASRAFLTLEPFMVSIVENYRVKGFIVLEVTLHLPQEDAQTRADDLSRKLRDSFVRTLMEYGAKVATISAKPSLDGITARLQTQADGVLGQGKSRILLTQALIRPL